METQDKHEIVKQKRAEAQEIAEAVAGVITQAPFDRSFTITPKHDHTKPLGIYAKSKPVRRYKDVRDVVERMTAWLNTNNGRFPEPHLTAYAVSHCQVAEVEDPLAFFVVSLELIQNTGVEFRKVDRGHNNKNFYFPAQAIFNAEILETPEKLDKTIPSREVAKVDGKMSSRIVTKPGKVDNLIEVPEGCMSFPLKKSKNKKRYHTIKVRYQIKGWFGLRTKTEWVEGLKAHIFQHEIEHAKGINMYYNR